MRVLIVEDSETKCREIVRVVQAVRPNAALVVASTVIEAEKEIAKGGWDLLVLDISLDIAPSKLGPRSRGQANIGGLAIAQKMFLLEQEVPTVIITAFDSFTTGGIGQSAAELVGFDEVKARAERYLPGVLLETLQYGSADWRDRFQVVVRKVGRT